MRHLTAARKGTDGGWHYVVMTRDGGHPIGFCADHDPHPTEAEARECYAAYRRERVRLDGELSSWTDCHAGRSSDAARSARCPNPTKRHARIDGDGYALAPLCEEHLTVEHAIKALHLDAPAGDAWVS